MSETTDSEANFYDRGSGKTEDFLALLGKSEHKIFAFVVAAAADLSYADDIMQNVRLDLWKQFDKFRPGSSFLAWAITVARYQVLTYRNKSYSDRLRFSPEVIDVIEQDFMADPSKVDARRQALAECFSKLSVRQKELIQKCYFSSLGITGAIKAVAESINKSPAAVYQSLWRIRRTLHGCINKRIQSSGS